MWESHAPAETEPPLVVTREGRVMVMTLNRPRALNAITRELANLAGTALDEAERDPEVWAVVIAGAGERAFSAGADLKELSTGITPYADTREWGFAGITEHYIAKPVIAAVNGLALGGGAEIAAYADLVIASENASFGLPEVKVGVLAGAGGLVRLPRQIPFRVAMHAALTGEPLSAQDAKRWGLVNDVLPAGEDLPAALALAQRICANAPIAVQSAKRVVHRIADSRSVEEERAWEVNERELGVVQASEDYLEGPRAFAEKRKPVWQGR